MKARTVPATKIKPQKQFWGFFYAMNLIISNGSSNKKHLTIFFD